MMFFAVFLGFEIDAIDESAVQNTESLIISKPIRMGATIPVQNFRSHLSAIPQRTDQINEQ
jgi:hypothetical protein